MGCYASPHRRDAARSASKRTLRAYAESRSRLEAVLSILGVKKSERSILFRELALHWEIATVLVVGVIQIETFEVFMSAVYG